MNANRVRYVQRRVLAKYRLLQLLQHWARFDPELGDQPLACLAVDAQRLCLPPGAIQREHVFEPVHVELVRRKMQHVAARLRDEEIGWLEHLAEPRYLMVEAVLRRSGRPFAPQLADQTVSGDDLVRVQEQKRKEGALFC